MKTPPQKVAYLGRNSVVSEMAEFMFPNVAYRATVYRTGTILVAVFDDLIMFAYRTPT